MAVKNHVISNDRPACVGVRKTQIFPTLIMPDEYAQLFEASARRHEIAIKRTQILLIIVLNLWLAATYQVMFAFDPVRAREPYHTSALSGAAWVMELLLGHKKRIRTELGVSKEVFSKLIEELQSMGCTGSRHVTLEEQLAIFLYMCVTGSTVRHAGERFQRSNDTIAK